MVIWVQAKNDFAMYKISGGRGLLWWSSDEDCLPVQELQVQSLISSPSPFLEEWHCLLNVYPAAILIPLQPVFLRYRSTNQFMLYFCLCCISNKIETPSQGLQGLTYCNHSFTLSSFTLPLAFCPYSLAILAIWWFLKHGKLISTSEFLYLLPIRDNHHSNITSIIVNTTDFYWTG